MHTRRGRINIVTVIIVGVLGAVLGGALLFGPYHWDYLVVKEITRTVALTWSETAIEKKAQQKFDEEIQAREVPAYFDHQQMCSMQETGQLYVVSCQWEVDVYYPLTDYYKTLAYSVTSEATRSGQVTTR